MSDFWRLRLYEEQKLVHTADLTGPAELGRQMPRKKPSTRSTLLTAGSAW